MCKTPGKELAYIERDPVYLAAAEQSEEDKERYDKKLEELEAEVLKLKQRLNRPKAKSSEEKAEDSRKERLRKYWESKDE